MLRFLKRKKTKTQVAQDGIIPTIPKGILAYAIGDIHGRYDLLLQILRLIYVDIAKFPGITRCVLIFLGDYIDRGPDSNQVIDALIGLCASDALEVIALRGNHDQFMLDFLKDASKGPLWMSFGGTQTLLAYGVAPPRRHDPDAWEETRAALQAAVPPEHLTFLEQTPYCATLGEYVFVHAGVRPGVAFKDQKPSDVLLIRDAFLECDDPMPGHVLVFGHTPFERPWVEAAKIGLDTGACVTGVLTALCLHENERHFLQTGAALGRVEVAAVSLERPRRL